MHLCTLSDNPVSLQYGIAGKGKHLYVYSIGTNSLCMSCSVPPPRSFGLQKASI